MAVLFPKIVELLGGGASLEEVDYLRQVLRYYSPALLPVYWFSIRQGMKNPSCACLTNAAAWHHAFSFTLDYNS